MTDNDTHHHHAEHHYGNGGLLGTDVTVFQSDYHHDHPHNGPHSHPDGEHTHHELTIPVPAITDKQMNEPEPDEIVLPKPSRMIWHGED